MRRLLIAAALILLGAACRPSVATPTPTPTPSVTPPAIPPLDTYTGPLIRATLPPTWTPTFTPTASVTWTPTPMTPTASLTPVPQVADLCASLTVQPGFTQGHTFQWDDTISLIYGTPLTVVSLSDQGTPVPISVRFLALHVQSGLNLGVQLDGGQTFVMQLPANRLPQPGYYRWTITLYGDGLGDRCPHTGSFFVAAPLATAEATAEATAAVTAAP